MSKKVYYNNTKFARIDVGLHMTLKVEAAKRQISLRELLEAYVYEGLERDGVTFITATNVQSKTSKN